LNKNINIIGVGGSIHDFSSCLLQNEKLVYYMEDERIVRKKHAFYEGMVKELLIHNASDECLKIKGLNIDDIDLVVGNDILSAFYFRRIQKEANQFISINHHLAHASSAFFPSAFNEAAILTIDGGGNEFNKDKHCKMLEVCSLSFGSGNNIEVLSTKAGERYKAEQFNNLIDPVTNSIGGFYGAATFACGFTFHEEGKTMGLAPYGTDKYLNELRQFVELTDNGVFRFSFEGLQFLYDIRRKIDMIPDKDKQFALKADIAYAAQAITEKALIHVAEYLKTITYSANLCIAGGVALNSVANYKLYKTGLFRDIFIQPAAGDNGTSIGSAFYGWHIFLKQPRIKQNNIGGHSYV